MERVMWDEARDALLRERWAAGQSQRQVSEALGTTPNAIAGRISRLGLKRGVGNSRWTHEAVRKLRELEREKKPRKVIGKEFGLSAGAVQSKLRRLREPPRPHVNITNVARIVPSHPRPSRDLQGPAKGAVELKWRSGSAYALLEHRSIECKWPIGDPLQDDFHMCCAPVEWCGAVYCRYHRLMGTVRR